MPAQTLSMAPTVTARENQRLGYPRCSALEESLAAAGFDVREEDVRRLTPLIWEHIELHGRYAFPEEQLAAGILRALRDPTEPEEPDL